MKDRISKTVAIGVSMTMMSVCDVTAVVGSMAMPVSVGVAAVTVTMHEAEPHHGDESD